jgi:hypothetical protein
MNKEQLKNKLDFEDDLEDKSYIEKMAFEIIKY